MSIIHILMYEMNVGADEHKDEMLSKAFMKS